MKFSIIIPVHNGEKFLNECMDSALAQKGDFETELVVVENGSTDGSASICDEYAAGHGNIRVFHEGRVGAYEARRIGMWNAEGDYLVFLDSDDALKEGALEALAGAVAKDLPEVVLYNAENMGSEGALKFSFPFKEDRIYSGEHKRAFYDLMCLGDSLNALWNKSLKKSLVDRIVAEDNRDTPGMFNHGEDLTQTAQILDKAESILFLNGSLYLYRKDNSSGLTTAYYPDYFDQQIFAWQQLEHYAKNWQRRDGEYDEVISKRKTLTCSIGVSTLLNADCPWKELKTELDAIMRKPFYREYVGGELPLWAPEEACYVHDIQTGDDPYRKLLLDCMMLRLKRSIKRLLGRK